MLKLKIDCQWVFVPYYRHFLMHILRWNTVVTSGFCRQAENYALLSYYAVSSSNFLPTFRNNLSVSPSGFRNSKGMLLFGKVHTTSNLGLRLYFCTMFRRRRYCLHFEVNELSQVDVEGSNVLVI
jgi:hypothetical protein